MKRLMIGMGLLMMGLWLGACQRVRCEGVHTIKPMPREFVMERLMEDGYLVDDEDTGLLVRRSFANEQQVDSFFDHDPYYEGFDDYFKRITENSLLVQGCFENFGKSEFWVGVTGYEFLDGIGGGDNTKSFSEIVEVIDNAMIDVIHQIEQGEHRYRHWSEFKITAVDMVQRRGWLVQIWLKVHGETVDYKVDYRK